MLGLLVWGCNVLHSKILSDSPIDIWTLPVALGMSSLLMHPKRVTVCYDDVGVDDGSRLSFTSGVISRFPSRGGVFRLMNSTVVGSLSPAWRSAASTFSGNTAREQHNLTITGQLLADWGTADLKNNTSCGHPGKKAISTPNFMTTPREPTVSPNIRMHPFPFPYESHFPKSCQQTNP